MSHLKKHVWNALGVQSLLVYPGVDTGTGGWLVTINPSSDWSGSYYLAQDQNAPGSYQTPLKVANLTPIPYASFTAQGAGFVSGTSAPNFITEAAGTLQNGSLTCVIGHPIYPTYGVVTTYYAGQLLATAVPCLAQLTTAAGLPANLSQLNLDSVPYNYSDEFEMVGALLDAGGITDQ